MKTPLTRERLKNHFTYSWWKYALLAVVAVFGLGLMFTTTRPQTAESEKVVVGIYGTGDQTAVDTYLEEVRQVLLPDMEEVSAMYITPDETYGNAVLTVRMAAQECDIYILPKESFQSYAQQGVFVALEEEMPELVSMLEEKGISLSRGWRTDNDTDEKHLYGIPCADLPYLDTFVYPNADSYYACVCLNTGNDENVRTFFTHFIEDMLSEVPATPTELTE